jgi:hypothetical protein
MQQNAAATVRHRDVALVKCKERGCNYHNGSICTTCYRPKPSLQEKAFKVIKKHFGLNTEYKVRDGAIKIYTKVLCDSDLELLKNIEGMYRDVLIKRSGNGIVVILSFSLTTAKALLKSF